MASALASPAFTKVAVGASAPRRAARSTAVRCVARAEQEPASRRMALGLFASTVAGMAAMVLTQDAQALSSPSQASTGGLGRQAGGKGSLPKNTSVASMEGYTMEGTRKQGVSAKRKAQVLQNLKKREGL